MSETPKPPEGYATWLDWVVEPKSVGPVWPNQREYASAELAALRADRDRLLELVRRADALVVNEPEEILQWLADAGRALGETR